MARKDKIFKSFLNHDILIDKYGISKNELPDNVRDGIYSDIPIVRSIALIVDSLEQSPPLSDNALRNKITQLLNEIAI